jgi:exodeoxyribonuclease VII small subunit
MAKEKQTYEEAYNELQSTLEEIENGNLNVDELTSTVKKATKLIKFCKSKLYETENEIEKILEELDQDESDKS